MSEKIVLTKMELLRMARELVINEYIDKRAQDHNKWLADAETAWKTRGVNLPYPSFPIYPTEADILSRATVLNTFLSQDSEAQKAIVDPVDLSVPVEPEPEPTVSMPEPVAVIPPATTVPGPVMTTVIPPVELPVMPATTSTIIHPDLLPPDVYANIVAAVPATPASAVLTVPEPFADDTTLSVIAQLKAKLGIK